MKIIEDFSKNNQLSSEYVKNSIRKDDFVKKYRPFTSDRNESTVI